MFPALFIQITFNTLVRREVTQSNPLGPLLSLAIYRMVNTHGG